MDELYFVSTKLRARNVWAVVVFYPGRSVCVYFEGALYFYALLNYVPKLFVHPRNLSLHNETTVKAKAKALTAFHTPYNNAQIALIYLFVIRPSKTALPK